MKDAINYTYGFGCHCRNCQHCTEYNIGDDKKMYRCIAGILKPEHMNQTSFCSVGKPKENVDADIHHDIASAIIHLREEIQKNNATEGYFEVELTSGKTLRVSLYKWSESLEICEHGKNSQHIGDLDLVAMIQNEVKYIDDIKIWNG